MAAALMPVIERALNNLSSDMRLDREILQRLACGGRQRDPIQR